MAISSWLEMGIGQKMDKDIRTSPTVRGHFDGKAFWTKKTGYENAILTLKHVFPSFLVLGFGIALSMMNFILEIVPCMNKRRKFAQQTSENTISCKCSETTTIPHETVTEEADKNTIMV